MKDQLDDLNRTNPMRSRFPIDITTFADQHRRLLLEDGEIVDGGPLPSKVHPEETRRT